MYPGGAGRRVKRDALVRRTSADGGGGGGGGGELKALHPSLVFGLAFAHNKLRPRVMEAMNTNKPPSERMTLMLMVRPVNSRLPCEPLGRDADR